MADFGEDYKDWVRQRKCAVCVEPPPSDPHHLKSKGAGGGPLVTMPLCRECHVLYHNMGHDSFEEYKDANLWRLAHRHLRRYIKATETYE